ncbi:hypothetical protein [Halobacterium yunchengense]|uniref:hypothetical protein n=1 Tax=Halobacterium yunchengense TaxID=3108497 RepID=UPI003007F642
MTDDPAFHHLRAGLDALPPVERTVGGGELRETRQFRGLTLDQAAGYLVSLGGERVRTDRVEGAGWTADLSARRVPVGPSYRLTEVTVTWAGDPEVLEPLIVRFRLKAFRAPG